jgi:hypothetical protein
MKRILLAFLLLAVVAVGAVAVSAQQATILSTASITTTNKVYAAWQPFEKGVMIWWSDLDQIWVLVNPSGSNTPGQALIYKDDWTNASYNYTAPSGRFAPVRGFGEIWHYMGGSQSYNQLGWALSPELGFDSAAREITGTSSNLTSFRIQGPGDTEYGVSFQSVGSGTYVGVGTYWVIDIG